MPSVGGEVELNRRYFWAQGVAGVYPVDQAAGVEQGCVSPGAGEVLCRLGMTQDFENAAIDARRIGSLPVCRERLTSASSARLTLASSVEPSSPKST